MPLKAIRVEPLADRRAARACLLKPIERHQALSPFEPIDR
jgi:hypothetical protein